jgi:hypothetical protein
MKNRIFLFVLALGVTALFSSCLDLMAAALNRPETHKIVLNEYNPVDQNVTLTYPGSLMLKRWNSSDMLDTMYNSKRSISTIDNVILTFPAGNNSFLFDVYIIFDTSTSYTSYRVPNVELPYLFEAGKKYQIKTRSKSNEFFAGIYDVTKRSVLLKEWKIGNRR